MPAHIAGALILDAAGAQALHVPYKGASESANAVIGRQVDFAITINSVSMPQVTAGLAIPLAVTGPRRNPRLPNVPTLAEAGMPDVTVVSFGGVSVPAGTPVPVVKRIGEALATVLARPAVRNRLEANGALAMPGTPQEYTEALQDEIERTAKIMRSLKLQPQ